MRWYSSSVMGKNRAVLEPVREGKLTVAEGKAAACQRIGNERNVSLARPFHYIIIQEQTPALIVLYQEKNAAARQGQRNNLWTTRFSP